MKPLFVGRYSGLFVVLGGIVAVASLACTWYLNRLQVDLARAGRRDAAGMEAAQDFQLQLRHLRVHSLVLVADPTDARREVVQADLARIDAAFEAIRQTATTAEDVLLADRIEQDYQQYRANLNFDGLRASARPISDLALWSDAHHMGELLVPCRELADRQRERMNESLERSETQVAWAGQGLLSLGLAGVLAGLLSGYATARGLTRRVAQLSVRVRAVQAHLDQEVGAMIVEGPHTGDVDEQLDQVVDRVKAVCQRLQEQERDLLRAEQLAAVGHLAAGVAHEVRNPLTGVKFLLQAAARPLNPTPLTPERVHLLLQEIARIERTVQGLIDFARTPPPDRKPHDLRDVLGAAVKIAQSRADLKTIDVHVHYPAEPLPVEVDHDQMLSLFTNLLVNAIDATPAGGRVEVTTAVDADGMIRVDVADTGPGIDPALAGRLFTPFATTKPTGTGLGLTVARRIAREHGGAVTAANGPDGGARFTLALPVAERAHAETPGR
ncbi:sensor histidine kinase [Fimbriiglobus ruber]|uniref:histidine kinase n=1 Tax=Fimbriiglobus ruber TaxID=1908690 RepID=A0A225DZA0_9BACT|nr:ATP-binding protein [Fimbriiglobus ruber]OWK41685.1 Two-component sensor histidine kinase [Fimbriiglobus ruber]